MTLLIPLGLLALLSVIALIIIYVIKPNYQQKHVSSTFIWQLSMKYKKKRLPISKLRNVLIIICQLLILAALALIISKPAQPLKDVVNQREVIAVIDSSASMRTEIAGESRFERAVEGAKKLSDEVFAQGGIVSVVVAEEQPYFLARRVTNERQTQLNDSLEILLEDGCSYGTSDLDGAMDSCEEILTENSAAKIHIFTDESFEYKPAAIEVVSVVDPEEWNAAILDASAENYENYYKFTAEIATYGVAAEIKLAVEVQGVNGQEERVYSFSTTVKCDGEHTKTVIFQNEDIPVNNVADNEEYIGIDVTKKIYSYQSVHFSIEADDNFDDDDAFNIFAGEKEVINVQYASMKVNGATSLGPFFPGLFDTLRKFYSDVWDIKVKTVVAGESAPATSGFDFYIFEHKLPEVMPTDGVVFIVNPDPTIKDNNMPVGADFRVRSLIDYDKKSQPLTEEATHPITNFVRAGNITVSRIVELSSYGAGYEVLLSCNGLPALLVKDEGAEKVVLMNFSVNYSNITITEDFSLIMLNAFEYFLPRTVSGNMFEVNESVKLNCRGNELTVTGGGVNEKFTEFPATLQLKLPGQYAITQETVFGKAVAENIYVRIPRAESNVLHTAETIKNPYAEQTGDGSFNDLIIFFAAALVALMTVEWLLQSRENM